MRRRIGLFTFSVAVLSLITILRQLGPAAGRYGDDAEGAVGYETRPESAASAPGASWMASRSATRARTRGMSSRP
jgi:hypothetical protein